MSDALERLRALQADDLPVHGGRTLAYVYDSGLPDVDQIGREAVAAYAGSNGLDPTAFPSLLQMENDLVGFAVGLLDGPDTAVGTVTSGGTESVLLAVTAQAAPVALVYVAVVLVGVGYAGCQVFPMAMLPDAAAVDARRTGSNRAGVYTGVWTAGETLGLALGPAVFALVLAIGGYRSSTDGDAAQPDSALTAITLGFSILPAVLIIASLWWLRRYALDHDTVDEIVSA